MENNDEIIWEVIPGHIIMIILTFISIFGTINIIIATFKNCALHGSCNFLLAANALFDSIHQCSHLIHGFILFSGIKHIPRLTCVYLGTIPLFGLNSGLICVFIIGIDRLFSVLSPGKHRNCNKKLYYLTFFCVNAIFNGIIFMGVYGYAFKNPAEKTTCFMPDVLGGYSSNLWFLSCIVLNIATIICYIFVAIILKSSKVNLTSTRKIFKAISFIMLMIFFGWTINAISRVIFGFANFSPKTNFIAAVYFGIFVNIACTSNYFILFKFSYDYQIVFKGFLNWICKTLTGKQPFNQIGISTNSMSTFIKVSGAK